MQSRTNDSHIGGFSLIQQKLQAFIRKYYINELIKGALLFTAIGLLYLIFTLLVEHFLWLGSTGRAVLFWLLPGVSVLLCYRFIALPLFRLFHLQKGISHEEASKIIGNHFPEVGDKLLNVLQLSGNGMGSETGKNELLMASIEQKSRELQPFPFHIAVDIKKNLHYAKYALVPVLIIILIWISGNINWFSDSYNRVVHYRSAFEPPAPFQFYVVNNTLNAIEGKPFEIRVRTTGDVVPEDVEIRFNGEAYFMQKEAAGSFSYVFKRPEKSLSFYLTANDVRSRPYELHVLNAPAMTGFEMHLDYPAYLGRSSDTLTGTGNATIPEGTKVTWKLQTRNADEVKWIWGDSVAYFRETERKGEQSAYRWSAQIYQDTQYEISTGSNDLPEYESLGFGISVVKDEYPEINVREVRDSVAVFETRFVGQVSDDHGFSALRMIYYPEGREADRSELKLDVSTSSSVDRFVRAFPAGLQLEKGTNYVLFFEVKDNDALRGGKTARSGLFTFRVRSDEEMEREQLHQQKDAINAIERSLGKMEEQQGEFREINTLNLEKEEKSFNDRQKIDHFLERQLQQEKNMQKFTRDLEENLREAAGEEPDDKRKRLLEERLQRQQEELKKNEKLLEELKNVADKIDREDMAKRLEKLSRSQQNGKRNLEQILELTKRYYVTQNAERLKRELEKLAKEQEGAAESKEEENTGEKQEELNRKFEEFKKEAGELGKENEGLKKPMDLGRDEKKEKSVSEDQEKALEHLKESEPGKAEKEQRNAARKMKEMADGMKSAMQSGASSDDMEDASVLRQILKNVVAFSFEQEDLMEVVNQMREDHPALAESVRKQYNLKEAFEHIDDSLFALSLRRPEISEIVNKEITDAHFYLEKAIASLSDNEVYRGVSDQQYIFTAANNLGALLGDILDNLQESMGMGQGSGDEEMQLPDIIQSQEELNEKMKQAMDGSGEEKEGEEKDGKQKGGEQGDGDGESGELFEIYKQQQILREALEKQLSDMREEEGKRAGKKLLNDMERVEDELLRDGLNQSVHKKMLDLKHQLLKLQDAAMEQGMENKRESRTNERRFEGSRGDFDPELEEYLKGVEILNRQVLPLRQIYKDKVKEYFRKDD